ncbi:MAG: hypothetical protein K6A23_14665 [Butyrivibrio sp.]|nr:hypothetical protein [Butyrivibrio sp.]
MKVLNKGNVFINKIAIVCSLLVATLLQLEYSPIGIMKKDVTGVDASVFKYVAFAMSKGQLPYKDVFDHKGPLIYFLDYIGMKISFYRGSWIIEFVFVFLTLVIFYKIARLKCSEISSVVVVFVATTPLYEYFYGGGLVEEYAMFFIGFATYIFLDYFINQKITGIRLIACGMCFGAVLMLRANMATLWVAFCIGVLLKCLIEKNIKDIIHFISLFLIGIMIIVLPFVIWMGMNGILSDFVEVYINFNMFYSSVEAGHTSIIGRIDTFDRFAKETFIIISVALICYKIYKERKLLDIVYLAYIIITLVFTSMSGWKSAHYAMIFVPIYVYPLSLIWEKKDSVAAPIFLVGIFYIMIFMVIPVWMDASLNFAKTVIEPKEMAPENKEIVEVISNFSDEEDYISVYGNSDWIYVVTHRLSASRFSYQTPVCDMVPEYMDQYWNDLNENQPKLFVTKNIEDKKVKEFLDNNQYDLLWKSGNDNPTYIFENKSF